MTPIVSVQNRYNVGDRRSESMLDFCEQEQIAFLPYSPVQDFEGHAAVHESRGAPRRHRDAGVPRVAAGPLAGDAADPGHRVGRAPRRERRRRDHRARPERGGRDHGVGELTVDAGSRPFTRQVPL